MKRERRKKKEEIRSGAKLITFLMIGAVATWISVGCAEKGSEPTRTTHPIGWTDTASVDFHGKYLAARGVVAGVANCRACHGVDSSVALTGVSCYGCHNQFPHPSGWSGSGTANLHQVALQQANWDMTSCKTCHGADYATPKMKADSSLVSCNTCHHAKGGPQNCRLCHGSPTSAAPPADLLGGTSSDLMTVGAHQAHLNGRKVSKGINCRECHAAMNGFSDPKHIDTSSVGIAEVTFGALATDSGRIAPVWDRNNGSCSSVYCHGSFDGGNDSLVVYWTRGQAEADCGTCHSFPPPAPHVQTGSCTSCHIYNITTHHINGVVDMK